MLLIQKNLISLVLLVSFGTAFAFSCPPPTVFTNTYVTVNFLNYGGVGWAPVSPYAMKMFQDVASNHYGRSCATNSLYGNCASNQEAPPLVDGKCTYQFIKVYTGTASDTWGSPITIAYGTAKK